MKLSNGQALLLAVDALERITGRPVTSRDVHTAIVRARPHMPTDLATSLGYYQGWPGRVHLALDGMREEGYLSWPLGVGGYTITGRGKDRVAELVDAGHDARCIEGVAA